MRRRPGVGLLAAAGALAAVTAVAGLAPTRAGAEPGGADSSGAATAPRSVVATGRAQGFRATYTIPDYVIVSEFFDGGGPVTESVADSTGRATSFSSLPWPGENAVTAPGTLSAAMGRSVPLAYPFHVRADYPTTPSAEVHDPTGSYAISATAAAGRAAATGGFGEGSGSAGGGSGSRAQTSAVLDDAGVVRVVAETADTGLSVGDGLLRIAAVRSRSETTLAPADTAPVTHSQLLVEGATVAGHAVTIGPDGVHAADHTVPAPVGQGASSDNELLGQAGISVSVAPTGKPGRADALVITSRQVIPAPNNPKGTLVIRVGGASSEIVVGSADLPVDAAAGAADGGPGPASSPEPSRSGPSAAGPVSGASGAAVTDSVAGDGRAGAARPGAVAVDREAAPYGPAAGAGPAGEPTGGAGSVAAPGTAAGSATVAAPALAARGLPPAPVLPDLATTGALFSVLGLGCLALLLATRLHRLKVVKVRG